MIESSRFMGSSSDACFPVLRRADHMNLFFGKSNVHTALVKKKPFWLRKEAQ
jgi:hypothetical protein